MATLMTRTGVRQKRGLDMRILSGVSRLAAGSMGVEHTFGDWHLNAIAVQDISSDTRHMPAVIARLTRP